MHTFLKQSIRIFLAFALVAATLGPVYASDAKSTVEPGAASMAFDLVVARPVGIAATAVGTALFIVSLPFSLLGGNSDVAYEKLIKDPARHAFQRPLGQL